MEKEEIKLRSLTIEDAQIQCRENEDGTESRKIGGRCIVFNRETTLWDGTYYRMREIVAPSACTAEFVATQDVKLNMLHDRELTMARNCKNDPKSTLTIEVREDGVYFECELPKCDIGDRALALVKNRTITGCSFEFQEGDVNRVETDLGNNKREILATHTAFKKLSAITLAIDPAYSGTSVKEREAFEQREQAAKDEQEAKDKEAKDKEEQEKVEQEKKEKQKREAATAERIAAIHREMEIQNY